jgi:predicted metal-binding membrane protein
VDPVDDICAATTSMVWMRSPGHGWLGAAASFVAMWLAMMVAMMLPSLVPALARYRNTVGRVAGAPLGGLTTLVAAGYFFVWTLAGVAVFPLGAVIATHVLHAPAILHSVPFVVGGVVFMAGVLQLTGWKRRALACCHGSAHCAGLVPPSPGMAWRHGVRLGVHCARCCAGLMAILLVVDVMDLRVMAVVTAAITLERLAPPSLRVERAIGAGAIGVASYLLARAAGLA